MIVYQIAGAALLMLVIAWFLRCIYDVVVAYFLIRFIERGMK